MFVPKVLLTGATGFVGSFIAEDLVNQGFSVYITLRKSSSTRWIENIPLEYIYIDLGSRQEIEEVCVKHQFDYIIHNAGLTRHPNEKELERVNASILGHFIAVLNQLEYKPQKFIYISSLAAYGSADLQPRAIVKRDSVPKPLTAYGRSKLKAEELLKNATFSFVCLRPTAVYGPKEKDLLTLFKTLNKGLNVEVGKGQKLSFIYVKDLSNVIVRCLKKNLKYNHYFVSDGQLYSSSEFSDLILKALKKKAIKLTLPKIMVKIICRVNDIAGKLLGFHPLLNGDKYHEIAAGSWNCDSSDLWEEIGEMPDYSLEKGVNETVEWYKREGWL